MSKSRTRKEKRNLIVSDKILPKRRRLRAEESTNQYGDSPENESNKNGF